MMKRKTYYAAMWALGFEAVTVRLYPHTNQIMCSFLPDSRTDETLISLRQYYLDTLSVT